MTPERQAEIRESFYSWLQAGMPQYQLLIWSRHAETLAKLKDKEPFLGAMHRPRNPERVRQVFRMSEEGLTPAQISKKLGVYPTAAITRLLKRWRYWYNHAQSN